MAKLVDHVRRNVPGANPRNEVHVAQSNVVKELQTMAAVLGNMQKQVKSHAAHRTRWRIQKDSHGKMLESLDDDGTIAVLVLDHKQKVVNVSFREAQVDYFEKRGKSFCGVNLIRRVRKGGKPGFEFVFLTLLLKDTTSRTTLRRITTEDVSQLMQHQEFGNRNTCLRFPMNIGSVFYRFSPPVILSLIWPFAGILHWLFVPPGPSHNLFPTTLHNCFYSTFLYLCTCTLHIVHFDQKTTCTALIVIDATFYFHTTTLHIK